MSSLRTRRRAYARWSWYSSAARALASDCTLESASASILFTTKENESTRGVRDYGEEGAIRRQ